MEYKYKLQYIDEATNTVVTHEFGADIDIESIRQRLAYFLLAVSWLPTQVEEILKYDI